MTGGVLGARPTRNLQDFIYFLLIKTGNLFDMGSAGGWEILCKMSPKWEISHPEWENCGLCVLLECDSDTKLLLQRRLVALMHQFP